MNDDVCQPAADRRGNPSRRSGGRCGAVPLADSHGVVADDPVGGLGGAVMTDAKFKALCVEIERLMDSHHISTFLEACGQVLAEKAEHVAGNWQDNVTANQIQAAANAVTDAAGYVE